MPWCKSCSDFMFSAERHRCPPAFVCQPADERCYGDGNQITVYAHDAEAAAEKFADRWDSDGDYDILRSGTGFEVKVTAPMGEVTYWCVHGESVPSYSASTSEEYPRDSDGPRMAETPQAARGEAGPARAAEGGIARDKQP